jgi:hypothetical protein
MEIIVEEKSDGGLILWSKDSGLPLTKTQVRHMLRKPRITKTQLRERVWTFLKGIVSHDIDETYIHLYDSYAQAKAKMDGSAYSPDSLKVRVTVESLVKLLES